MPKLKPGTEMPTPQDDAATAAASAADPDGAPLTDAEWAAARPTVRLGRPPGLRPRKQSTTIRFDADVLASLKASGKGWQTRVNEAMREWIKTRGA
jgi:uncharacterized protein (DUF4415 family)